MVKLFSARIQTFYFRFLIGRNKRFIGLMTATMMVVYPVFVMTILSLNDFTAPNELFLTGRILAILFFVFFSILVPILMFGYLNNKRDLDVYFSLPIKREQMLQTTGWAGYFILLIPFALTWWTGGLLAMIYANLSLFILFESFITAILIGSAIYMVVVFTMMNTGTTLDAFLYSLGVHLIPFLAYGAYILFGYSMLLGFSDINSIRILNFISPIWAIFNTIFATSDLLFPPMAYGLYWVMISLVLCAVSSYLYTIRPSEKAENPFVNKRFFPIISTTYAVLTLILLYNFIYNTNSSTSLLTIPNLIFPLMFAGILYLIMDTIANRSTKNLGKAMMSYALVAAITLSVFIPSTLTGGFGYVTRVPKVTNVKSVELNLTGSSGLFFPSNNLSYSYNSFDGYTAEAARILKALQTPDLVFDSEADIQAIIDFHKIILSEYKWVDYSTKSYPARGYAGDVLNEIPGYTPSFEPFPFDNLDYGTTTVTFTYRLNDGSKFRRNYETSAMWSKNLTELLASETMVKLSAPLIANRGLFDSISGFKLHDALMTNVNANLAGFDFEAFVSEYMKDIDAIALDGTIEPTSTLVAYLELSAVKKLTISNALTVSDRIAIDSRFTNTLAWLTSKGYAIPQARYDEDTAVLVLPKAATKNAIFFIANASTSIYSYSENESEVVYVRLTPEQMVKIAPYLSASGFSETALPTVFTVNNVVKGDVSNSEAYNPMGLMNLLVQAQHVDEVLAIVADNPREIGRGFNFFTDTNLLSGRFVDDSGRAEYVFEGNRATKFYDGKLYDECEYYIDASGNHIIIEYRSSEDPDTKPIAIESALWNVDPSGESFTHNFLGVSTSISFEFKKVSD